MPRWQARQAHSAAAAAHLGVVLVADGRAAARGPLAPAVPARQAAAAQVAQRTSRVQLGGAALLAAAASLRVGLAARVAGLLLPPVPAAAAGQRVGGRQVRPQRVRLLHEGGVEGVGGAAAEGKRQRARPAAQRVEIQILVHLLLLLLLLLLLSLLLALPLGSGAAAEAGRRGRDQQC
jgi:hypothetical protein